MLLAVAGSLLLMVLACVAVTRIGEPVRDLPVRPLSRFVLPRAMPIQLVFVSEHSGVIELDCVMGKAEPGDDGSAAGDAPRGTPFTLEAQLPVSAAWAAGAAESVLRQWASNGSVVEMAMVENGAGSNVRLSSSDTLLQLALA